MTFAQKLGPGYEAVRSAARIKTIKVNLNDAECELKVRIPVKREMEELTASIAVPESALVEKIYNDLAAPLRKTLDESGDDFLEAINEDEERIKITDNDVIVSGTSVRQMAQFTAIWQKQVEAYFALLQSPTGEPINESFEVISDEFPEAVIKEIVTKIDGAIRPNYKEAKKN